MFKNLIERNDILQLIAGNEEIFSLVYGQYSGQVYRLAFRFLKDAGQSEEIVQETFISLWLSRHRLDPAGDLWLYVYVIARRKSINALRQIIQSAELAARLREKIDYIQHSDEEEILAADLENFANTVIGNLPRQQQLIFKLSRTEGLSHQEIADQLHLSPNTVRNHIVEALKTLRIELRYSDIIFFLALSYWIS